MGHEKIGQYEILFGEIPDQKHDSTPDLKDIDWGNYSEENLKAEKDREKERLEDIEDQEQEEQKINETLTREDWEKEELAKIREGISNIEEPEEAKKEEPKEKEIEKDNENIPDETDWHNRLNERIEENKKEKDNQKKITKVRTEEKKNFKKIWNKYNQR